MVCLFTEFTSNVAAATLFIPILAGLVSYELKLICYAQNYYRTIFKVLFCVIILLNKGIYQGLPKHGILAAPLKYGKIVFVRK